MSSAATRAADLPKTFQAAEVEARWHQLWRDRDYFTANVAAPGLPYSIVIPPPNVTGVLHMGHGLPQTIQDLLTRYHRMRGDNAVWVPGTDHAGIATQSVVSNRLRAEGRPPESMSREEFLSECWKWKEQSEATIVSQVRALGGSCDWSRYAFTMDDTRAKSVRHAFKQLYDKGLIYRGLYLVNWDPVALTALSDDEVEHEEEEGRLWEIHYPAEDGGEGAIVATTRPETLFGDVAVAVHPNDERYRHLIGKRVRLPLTDRTIPIVADDFVKTDFGTGMVKITPAHDHNDFLCGQRLNLEQRNVFTDDARLNEHGGRFAGLERFDARQKVLAALRAEGLLRSEKKHLQRIGRSYRSKAIVEPRLSEQWFVSMRPLADMAMKAVREGEVRIAPKTFEGVFFHWMENVRDWCISRQLVWGHRIPIWYRKDDPAQRICFDGDGVPPEVAANPDAWSQDPDVLDTWFSSGLWPFSVFGWPNDTADLRKWFPTSVLVTGHDILFFWVARMMMMSYALTGKAPFRDVFLHGLIFGKSYYERKGETMRLIMGEERRQLEDMPKLPKGVEFKWEKMSKSKGNVIDPLEVGRDFGMDALRLTLTAYASQGRTIDLDKSRFEGYRNFVNKLWNASRFVLMMTEDLDAAAYREGLAGRTIAVEDKWLISQLERTREAVTAALDSYEFDQYVNAIYNFFWRNYCDWYIELAKTRTTGGDADATTAKLVLVTALEQVCRLLAPVIPFAAEEVWQLLRGRITAKTPGEADPTLAGTHAAPFAAPSLCVAPWPAANPDAINPSAEAALLSLQEFITAIRNIRGEMTVPPDMKVDVLVQEESAEGRALLEGARKAVAALAQVANLTISPTIAAPAFASMAIDGSRTIYVPLPEELRKSEQARLAKEIQRLQNGIKGSEAKLSQPTFVEKAPPPVVEAERARLAKMQEECATLQAKHDALGC